MRNEGYDYRERRKIEREGTGEREKGGKEGRKKEELEGGKNVKIEKQGDGEKNDGG